MKGEDESPWIGFKEREMQTEDHSSRIAVRNTRAGKTTEGP